VYPIKHITSCIKTGYDRLVLKVVSQFRFAAMPVHNKT